MVNGLMVRSCRHTTHSPSTDCFSTFDTTFNTAKDAEEHCKMNMTQKLYGGIGQLVIRFKAKIHRKILAT